MKTPILFIVFWFYFSLVSCFGQFEPYSVVIGIEEGLPSNNVYNIFQDSKGFLWFATDVGVIKYDGYEFEILNTDNGLSDNEIFNFFEDQNGRIWFLSLNGKLSYYLEHKIFNKTNHEALVDLDGQHMVVAIKEFGKELYILFKNGCLKKFKNNTITTLIEKGPTSYGLIENDTDLYVLDSDKVKGVYSNKIIHLPEYVKKGLPIRYFSEKKKAPFIALNNTIYKFQKDQFEKIETLQDKEILSVNYSQDQLVVGTTEGVILIENNDTETLLHSYLVSDYIKDYEGNLWFSTLNAGVIFVSSLDVKSVSLNNKNIKIKCLEYDSLNDKLLIGTNRGLFQFENKIEPYFYSSKKTFPTYIRNIKLTENTLWILGNTSSRINNNTLDHFYFAANDLAYYNNKILITTPTNTYLFDEAALDLLKKNYTKLPDIIRKQSPILFKRSNCLVEGKNQTYYIGTNSGLYAYHDKEIQAINSTEYNFAVRDLAFNSKRDKILIGTNSDGVILLDTKNNASEKLNLNKGLNSNQCNKILAVDTDYYVVATNKGLNTIHWINDSLHIKNLSNHLNIPNLRFVDIVMKDSLLVAATEKELISFPLNSNQLNKLKPKIYLKSFFAGSELKETYKKLSHKENTITLNYSALSFSSKNSIHYLYRLNSEKEWNKTESRQLIFNNLSSGAYLIEIKAVNNFLKESDPLKIKFEIQPPFWKSFLFIFICLFLIFFLAFLIIKNRIKAYKLKNEQEKENLRIAQEKAVVEKKIAEVEQDVLRLQMNPHFLFNALNTIKGYYSAGDIYEANKYIVKFSKLLRLILESSEKLISLKQEIEILKLYLELLQIRYQDSFEYSFHCDPKLDLENIGIPPMLLQPLVENAVIHGLGPLKTTGMLKINMKYKTTHIICEIIDNGIGIAKSQKKIKPYTSKALSITRERINFLNNHSDPKNLEIYNNIPQGTIVKIKLPIINIWE